MQTNRRIFLGQSFALAAAAGFAITAPASATTPTKDNKLNAAHPQDRFTLTNSIIMLVDHQTGTVGWVKSQPQKVTIASSRAMARMALEYNMPLILTTTMEENVGPTISDLAQLAPGVI